MNSRSTLKWLRDSENFIVETARIIEHVAIRLLVLGSSLYVLYEIAKHPKIHY